MMSSRLPASSAQDGSIPRAEELRAAAAKRSISEELVAIFSDMRLIAFVDAGCTVEDIYRVARFWSKSRRRQQTAVLPAVVTPDAANNYHKEMVRQQREEDRYN